MAVGMYSVDRMALNKTVLTASTWTDCGANSIVGSVASSCVVS